MSKKIIKIFQKPNVLLCHIMACNLCAKIFCDVFYVLPSLRCIMCTVVWALLMYTYICFLLILATARMGSHKEGRLTTFVHLIFKILTRLFFCYHVKDLTRNDALLSLSFGREYGLFPFLHFDGHSPSCYSTLNAPLNGIRLSLYVNYTMEHCCHKTDLNT